MLSSYATRNLYGEDGYGNGFHIFFKREQD